MCGGFWSQAGSCSRPGTADPEVSGVCNTRSRSCVWPPWTEAELRTRAFLPRAPRRQGSPPALGSLSRGGPPMALELSLRSGRSASWVGPDAGGEGKYNLFTVWGVGRG